ncbi:MAG: glycoside hydrolase family 2 protein [Lachnospiraceae bacterium]|nr:glycoside hydrolase family 2 protein [Lachnospiraceae bacterium]
MKRFDLNGTWEMTGNGYCCTGKIPGSVYSFLLDAGLMEDPFFRENETGALALMAHDYTFTRTFSFAPPSCRTLLCLDGLDTLCTIVLNGNEVAKTKNMHRHYEFDVTALLRSGGNELALTFASPTKYCDERNAADPLWSMKLSYPGYSHLRKANCMMGWDWGPMLPDAGIWRDIYLLTEDSARITDCRILQRHENDRVFLTVTAETTLPCALTAELTSPEGAKTELPVGKETEVSDPKLWWPNGLGDQPLYTVTVRTDGDEVTKRIGLRTLTLVREPDEWGECFCHEVNGVRFFAMGADYIPEDNILSRITQERSRRLLEDAADAHFNVIRVWGGGYYPDDWFFDICDELGLVVFQDMMVACAFVPDTDEMRNELAAEVRQNLLRIRHHACLGVIAGNNEVEAKLSSKTRTVTASERENYLRIYEHIFPEIVREVCPEIPYVPCSPSSHGGGKDPLNENVGDQHYWDVWHKWLPFSDYRNHFFRYLSEFGFESFPCEKTMETFTLPEDRNIFSHVMDRHQRRPGCNGKIMGYLAESFPYPADFETLLYATQLNQAMAIRCGVEHLRRNRGRCMGALYWQLNDIWPGPCWSSIDNCGRWKALHYAAKRFYAPVLLSCEEHGEGDALIASNGLPVYPDRITPSAAFSVQNESRQHFTGAVRWALRAADGLTLASGETKVSVPALSAAALPALDLPKFDVHAAYLFAALLAEDGSELSSGATLFTAPKNYKYRDPKLSFTRKGSEITVYAEDFAMFVEIDSPDSDFLLSDNYFDMERGEKTVKILRGEPKTIRVRSAYDIR